MRILLFIAGIIAMLLLFLLSPLLQEMANRARQRLYLWSPRLLARAAVAQMVAATGVAVQDRPGGFHFQIPFRLNPGAIAAGGREVETIAVPGAVVGDGVIVCPQYATSLIVGYATCRVAGTIEFALENNTAGALDEADSPWVAYIIRGTTGPLR